ncbi:MULTISPECIES: Crp/Fnr family transcriptional regulator [Streptomyces]|uniref:Transcriptional regulator, Crp/Fnr family n=2 Tax=Streptomyces TaxID=1883 RepID=A0A380P620_STRGR|nr:MULTISPECIES: Crp/Fnr family transcriptional regulator [Streptomyces]NEE43533.1 Crp/Fnr family transcriptional regulator [Streptomyces sp. SID8455]MDQ0292085.1 CRP-like cAMP-binding protein [Streptomyces sp. DSM 41037]NEC11493.1 Crp/Fnr family transcriptional regulator [Streptomyces sp. SID8014]PJM84317.1 hypothetical protein CH313_10385 [Streptomyces sp. TSRI0384-2]QNE84409.1 cyclic nucleotide-binding domain-containing protein [Streptomyces rutgersensis]
MVQSLHLTEVRKFTELIAARIQGDGQRPQGAVVLRGEHIYNCADTDRNVYFVKSGQVKTIMVTASGKRCLLDLYLPGNVFGELCLTNPRRTDTAVAMADTELVRVSHQRLLAILDREGLLELFTAYLTDRLAEQQRIIADLVTLESEMRLAARLLQLSKRFGQRCDRGMLISVRLTQEELAEMVGTTRSRVGFFLKTFREAGLLVSSRGPIIINQPNLASYVGERLPLGRGLL